MFIGRYSKTLFLSNSGTSIHIPVPLKAKTVCYRVTHLGPDPPGQNQLLIGTRRYQGATLGNNFSGYLDQRVFDLAWPLFVTDARRDFSGECDLHGADFLSWSIASAFGGDLAISLVLDFYDTNDCQFLGEWTATRLKAGGSASEIIYISNAAACGSMAWLNNVDGAGAAIQNRLFTRLDINDLAISMPNVTGGPIFAVTAVNQLTNGRNSIYNNFPSFAWEIAANAATATEFFLRLRWFKN